GRADPAGPGGRGTGSRGGAGGGVRVAGRRPRRPPRRGPRRRRPRGPRPAGRVRRADAAPVAGPVRAVQAAGDPPHRGGGRPAGGRHPPRRPDPDRARRLPARQLHRLPGRRRGAGRARLGALHARRSAGRPGPAAHVLDGARRRVLRPLLGADPGAGLPGPEGRRRPLRRPLRARPVRPRLLRRPGLLEGRLHPRRGLRPLRLRAVPRHRRQLAQLRGRRPEDGRGRGGGGQPQRPLTTAAAMTARVLVTRPLPAGGTDPLTDPAGPGPPCEVIQRPQDEALDRAALGAALADGYDGVVCLLTERFDAEVLAAARGRLRVVANVAVGFDNIDVEAATAAGVVVCNTPDVLDETTADLAFALILAAARRTSEAEAALRSGRWTGFHIDEFLGTDVHGATLGLVGYGR